MIPILYDKTETTFTSNGLARLTECTRCIVTEERNGVYEAEFDFPITSPKYELIQEGRIIAATHDDNGDIQAFDIYHRTAPLNGIVTFYARHISYRQIGIVVEPFTASGVANAIAGIKTNSYGVNPFTYSTDKTTAGEYKVQRPSSAKALLCGEEGSLLDTFGAGEYEFDMFNVKLWTRRGADTDVEIRYGKNLAEIENDVDYSETYNGVAPYWLGNGATPESESGDEDPEPVLVMLPEVAVMASGATYDGRDTILPLDLSGEFQDPPTENELRTLATQKLNQADTLTPIENITVSFVQLWQTEEYANIAPLQKVGLCDTVHVIFTELGVDKAAVKVIKTVYNTLLDRYDEMELGQPLASYAAIITANNTAAIAQLEDGLLMVSSAAVQAQSDADDAHRAAISAQADAGDALIAAGNAVTQAGNAKTAADNAQDSADAAQTSANDAALQASTAGIYANSALDQLNIVQDVVGVLDLLSTNANYQLTADTEIQPGKWYFTRSGYPGGTETGSIVSFDTVAGTKASSVVADIEPIQDLHGYDAPWVGGAGKNLLPPLTTETKNYVTLTSNNGIYTINGTASATTDFNLSINIPSGTYTLALLNATTNSNITVYLITQSGTGNPSTSPTVANNKVTFTKNEPLVTLRIRVASGAALNNFVLSPMLVSGSTAPTAWTPYENICPISGHTEVVVSRTGKNLLDSTLLINASLNTASGIITPGTSNRVVANKMHIPPNTQITVSVQSPYQIGSACVYDGSGNYLQTITLYSWTDGSYTFSIPSGAYYFATNFRKSDNANISPSDLNVQIELGSTATTYEPYQGDTYTTALGTTVYGGTLDVTTGVLTVTHKCISLNGWTQNWAGWIQANDYDRAWVNATSKLTGIKTTGGLQTTAKFNYFESTGSAVGLTAGKAYLDNGWLNVCFPKGMFGSYTEIKDWIATTDLQVCYELATPTTTTLTAQEIELLTHNNIWANSGDITVVYPSTYSYAVVSNPDVSDIGTYYEMVSIDQAVESYVTSRLAVTSDGLWVQDPGMATKILLSSTDGVVLYGPNGSIIGKYGATAQIGDAASFHIEMDGSELGFYQADRKVAYISNQQLYITQSVVLQQMDLGTKVVDGGLGQWSWKVHPNGATPSRNNLNLKWIG